MVHEPAVISCTFPSIDNSDERDSSIARYSVPRYFF